MMILTGLAFNKASLADINKVVKRMYNVEIDFHTVHAAKAFTGSLDRHQPLTSFLEILKFSGCISQYEVAADGSVSIR